MLIGGVVASFILPIDLVAKAREQHEAPTEAIAETTEARLRLILMAAPIIIFALLPLLRGFGGVTMLISSSLAMQVSASLLTSAFPTLLVVR